MNFVTRILTTSLTAALACSAPFGHAAEPASATTKVGAEIRSLSGPSDDATLAALRVGVGQVRSFFGRDFPHPFGVRFHGHRAELDLQWEQDWKMPDFKSECWMVASGTGEVLDILSPTVWSGEACEHDARDLVALQRLVTHELTHVFHGQMNPSSDFAEVEGLDWFVEGLAVLVSGQLTEQRLADVRSAVAKDTTPAQLNDFWKGKLRYGLSGSVVAWLDSRYGRPTLLQLLSARSQPELLQRLGLTQAQLLQDWRHSILP